MSGEDEGSIAIGSRLIMANLIMQLDQAGLHHRSVLVRGAMAGTICLAEIARGGIPSFKAIERTGRPALIVIGDDDGAAPGPAAWEAVRRLTNWARGAMIHATGACDLSYQRAIDLAIAYRRFVLIETTAAHARQWGDVLLKAPRPIPFELLLPTNGQHPVPPAVIQ
jgi:hypothetical protein